MFTFYSTHFLHTFVRQLVRCECFLSLTLVWFDAFGRERGFMLHPRCRAHCSYNKVAHWSLSSTFNHFHRRPSTFCSSVVSLNSLVIYSVFQDCISAHILYIFIVVRCSCCCCCCCCLCLGFVVLLSFYSFRICIVFMFSCSIGFVAWNKRSYIHCVEADTRADRRWSLHPVADSNGKQRDSIMTF